MKLIPASNAITGNMYVINVLAISKMMSTTSVFAILSLSFHSLQGATG